MWPEALCEHVFALSAVGFSEPRQTLQILSRSALGLVDVYNLLPAQVVCQKSVASMQHELQALSKFRVRNGDSYWLHTSSPRVPLHEHPLQLFS